MCVLVCTLSVVCDCVPVRACPCVSGWLSVSVSQGGDQVGSIRASVGEHCSSRRLDRKAKKIIKDLSLPSHGLFTPLPSRRVRQYRYIKAGTERLINSFSLPGHQNETVNTSRPPSSTLLWTLDSVTSRLLPSTLPCTLETAARCTESLNTGHFNNVYILFYPLHMYILYSSPNVSYLTIVLHILFSTDMLHILQIYYIFYRYTT